MNSFTIVFLLLFVTLAPTAIADPVTLFDDADGDFAVSVFGDASGSWFAASVFGDVESSGGAVTIFGNSFAPVALSLCGKTHSPENQQGGIICRAQFVQTTQESSGLCGDSLHVVVGYSDAMPFRCGDTCSGVIVTIAIMSEANACTDGGGCRGVLIGLALIGGHSSTCSTDVA